MSIIVTGYPSTTSQSFATPDSYDSSELVRYLIIDATDFPNDEYLEVEYNSETITIDLLTECRYTPFQVHFQNKEGAQHVLTFYKLRTDTLSVDREEFESDRGQASLGNHQFVNYNINGRTKFKANSGFVDEDNNEIFKQLMLSRRVWVYENDAFTPVNVSKRSIEYKTRQKDKLINYEFDFEYSYNEINNI